MTYNVFSGTLNPTQSVSLTLVVGWPERHMSEVSLWNIWWTRTKQGAANWNSTL